MIPASINLIPEAPVAEIVRLAVLAESLGFQRCWVYDEGLATRDVYVTMTAIAAATTTIAIGTGITNPFTRHAATTAAAIASLDEFSGGRAFLGIGAGGSLTLGPLGIDRSAPLTAVRETIESCRQLFSGRVTTLDGSTVRLREAQLGFARSDIEIWLAGRGPKMLALGGALCDGVMLDFIHRDSMAEYVNVVRAGAASAGNAPRLCYSTMVITNDAAMEQTRPHMTYRLVDSPPSVRKVLGVTDDDVAAIRAEMANGLHAAGRLVRPEWVTPFVVSGSVEGCADQIAQLTSEHGIDEFLLPILDLPQAESLMTTVAAVLQRT